MKTYYDRLSQPEIDFLLENCNFTADKSEDKVFILACKGCCNVAIAQKLNISLSSVTRKKNAVLAKIQNFLGGMDRMTTVYVNGKKVPFIKLKKHEISSEDIKRDIQSKLFNG